MVQEPLVALKERFEGLSDWNKEDIHQCIIEVAESFEMKLGKIGQPLRVAVTGGSTSPPIDVTVELLGKDRVLKGMEQALKYIEARNS